MQNTTLKQTTIQTAPDELVAVNGQRPQVGIMGGTFNPPHIGHLMMADQAANQLGLDYVVFMPDANPPHVDHKETIPAIQRVEMVKRAIADNPF